MSSSVGKIVPMLLVPKMDLALTFWCESMGFELLGSYEDNGKTVWATIRQGETSIMLALNTPEKGKAPKDDAKGTVLYFYPEDVKALHAAFIEKKIAVTDIEESFYGMNEFECIAPGGHTLWFGQAIDDDEDE